MASVFEGGRYEVGYREQTTERFSWDLTTFYNVYDGLEEMQTLTGPWPYHALQYVNNGSAKTTGAELAVNWAVTDTWNLYMQYTYLWMDVYNASNIAIYRNGVDPKNQMYLKSSWDLRENLDFDMIIRYVDRLERFLVPSYLELDMRLAWRLCGAAVLSRYGTRARDIRSLAHILHQLLAKQEHCSQLWAKLHAYRKSRLQLKKWSP